MLMPSKWVPNAAETTGDLAESHDRNFEFCPAKSQLYHGGGKTAAGSAAE
jgi:hypothetical protein